MQEQRGGRGRGGIVQDDMMMVWQSHIAMAAEVNRSILRRLQHGGVCEAATAQGATRCQAFEQPNANPLAYF